MTFAAPLFLLLGFGLASSVVALHLLARRSPRARDLPTVRFVPERQVSAPAPTLPPSDLLLLFLRVAAVVLLSVAFARPSLDVRDGDRRVILVDRSASVAAITEVLDSAVRFVRPQDVLLAFDTTVVRIEALDQLQGSAAQGSLTAALIAGVRAAREIAQGADSIGLVFVSAFAREEWDSATSRAREVWPGRVRLVTVEAAPAPPRGVRGTLASDDPLTATLALTDMSRPGAAARLVRGGVSASDSTWAHENGGTVISWPRSFGTPRDTVGAVMFADAVVVAEWERPGVRLDGRPVAWWVDGATAAVERTVGAGCVREIAVPVPEASDLPLRPSFGAFLEQATAPCGGHRRLDVLPESLLRHFVGEGPLAVARGFAEPRSPQVPANVWLLGLALGALLVEPLVRKKVT